MAQLHEILAVDKDREHQAKQIINETIRVWKKPDSFFATQKWLEMFDEDRQKEAESQGEDTAMTTTVPDRLGYTAEFLINYLDVLMQKESTNQKAMADIVLEDGTVIAEKVPATMLLGLERELARYRQIFATIPTLDSSVEWTEDNDAGEHIFKAVHPAKTQKTEKSLQVISLAEATKHHKEQVTTINKDKVVGQYTTQKWCGMITSAKKAVYLKRLDDLIAAAKQARMRANETEIVKSVIGSKLFDFILE